MISSFDLCAALTDLARQIGEAKPQILERWRARVTADPRIVGVSHMTRSQFNDHIPLILDTFCAKLCAVPGSNQTNALETEMAQQHSQHRWQQGYKVRSLVSEWGHLNTCVIATLDSLPAETPALAQARVLWTEFVNHNIGEGVAEYEVLLKTEASARLGDLESALETMRLLEAERGEMLREVSHDLRGGLSVVTGASSLLEHQNISSTDREQVVSILQSGVRSVTQMLGDLMTMARLEAGHEERQNLPFDAGQLLRELCNDAQLLATQKHLFLRVEGPETLIAQGDVSKVRRIAQNLLLNALKYTAAGGVVVSCQAISDAQWSFTISDTGPGLNRSGAAALAGKIAKATDEAQEIGAQPPGDSPGDESSDSPQKSAATRNLPTAIPNATPNAPGVSSGGSPVLELQAGEGIGLSIVRRLCELLDATLELESGDRQGSTFRVILPRAYQEKPAQ